MTSYAPGSDLGRYRLVRSLGRGGMGEVWEAVLSGPAGFRRLVALKLMRADAAESPFALANEARLGAALQHPNVVGTWDVGRLGETWYVAMELVDGAPLTALLQAGPLSPAAVLDVGEQVCAGLHHLHDAGIVHRDVKPSNLLVDRHGFVKIADLGVSMILGTRQVAAGTAAYMAPEQREGRADIRSDLFSVGATLFVAATGRKPFGSGATALARIRRVEDLLAEGLLDPVEAALPRLGEVLRRCLRADPHARWGSARELAAALAALRRHAVGPGIREALARVRPAPALEPSSRAATVLLSAPAPGNLPRSRDPFFGRTDEVAEGVASLRAGAGLTTLTGLGGSGKTRLALEVARTLAPDLAGGAWFFELAEARSVEGLCFGVARELGLVLDRLDPIGQIGSVLAARGPQVVVLDNLEQVVEAAAPLVGRWVAAAPETRFLCTSRVPLRIGGEHTVPIGPLTLEAGVALFAARAARGGGAEEDVRAIVEAVEGFPLAIELAAARTRLLSLPELRRRLVEALRLLAGGERDRPERHRSLRASLQGSWELLPAWGREAMAELSVLEGGFDLAAAEAVLDTAALPEGGWALDALTELAEASLLRVQAESARFRMHPFVRRYAEEAAAPGRLEAARERHGEHFARFADGALAGLSRPGGAERLQALVLETDNLVAACRRAVARGDGRVATRTARAAEEVFSRRGPLSTGIALLEAALPIAADLDRPELVAALAMALVHAGRAAEALPLMDEGGGADAVALGTRGVVLYQLGRAEEAVAAYRDALEVARAAGDRRLVAVVLGNLGNVLNERGQTHEAIALFEEALASHRELGDVRAVAGELLSLGNAAWAGGRTAEARARYEEAIASYRAIGDRRLEGIALGNLGSVELDEGRIEAATVRLEQALEVHRQVGGRKSEVYALVNLAEVDLRRWRRDSAGERAAAALALSREIGNPRLEADAVALQGRVALAQGDLPGAEAHASAALVLAERIPYPRLEAQLHWDLARAALGRGELAEARTRAERALAVCRARGFDLHAACVLGTLAEIDLADGALREARLRIDAALEAAVPDALEAARIACVAARVALAVGDRRRAGQAISQAREAHARAGLADEDPVGSALAELSAALGSRG